MKKIILQAVAAVLSLAICSFAASAQRVTVTLAGSGVAGNTGDGGSAKLAQVSGPKDICMDAAQNIYFIDKASGVIRMISADKGIITTVAGGGSSVVDGVPATTASISPNYLCVSATGKLYFTTAAQIRMVDLSTGIITTVAGGYTGGFSGDGGLATAATLNNPQGICIDAANNIYVVDRGNQCVRKIDATTGKIYTIAGHGTIFGYAGDGLPAASSYLSGPVCICINPAGDLFISDQNPNYPSYDNSVIREISAATGIISTVAGAVTGGIGTYDVIATDAILGTTTGLCFCNGELYCNEMSCSCRRLNFVTDTLYIVGGNFAIEGYSNDTTSPLANMNTPYGLCTDPYGSVYVADSGNHRLRKIIQLSHTPAFAYGHGVYIDPTASIAWPLDSLMWITDIDLGQTETWSVVSFPMHGTLAGFPATALSTGDVMTTKATGLSYTPSSTYAGADFFRVRVSDGTLADTITVYVGPNSSLDPLAVINTTAAGAAGISIFPNPATSTINIQCRNGSAEPAGITISDATGRIYYNTAVPAHTGRYDTQVNIAGLPAGSYFVKSGQETAKFVKE